MQVSITIKGSREVRQKLKGLGRSLYNFKGAMKTIGTLAISYYQNQAFNSQGGVYGNVWPRLSPRTIATKMRLYPQYVNSPLIASRKMVNSFVAVSNETSVVISNEMPYYKYHQSTLPRRKIPRRQMAGINGPIRSIVKKTLQEDITRKIRNA